MSKNPLLPKEYSDSGTQSAIFFALGPYKINDRSDIVNPQLKWNLQQAWQDAQELLAKAQWVSLGNNIGTPEEGFEISADTDDEINTLNAMVAGIVACQIIHPDAGVMLRRVEHRKGGEMALIISSDVLGKLKTLLPHLAASGDATGNRKRWWSMLNWKKPIKRSSNG